MSKVGKLIEALESAQRYLQPNEQAKQQVQQSEITPKSTMKARSKLNRILGNKTTPKSARPPLLSRVGVDNKPTISLISDVVLGKDSDNYRSRISFDQPNNDISSTVSERLKNLRERTLSKISSDVSISESEFYGYESDGTPIWSSVVSGQRKLDSRSYNSKKADKVNPHHHSIQIPIKINWPKQLQISSHNNFKTWYTVSENKRATQLAEQIIGTVHKSLNPFIIIGDSQSGKSHLLNAIGQAVLVSGEVTIYMIRGEDLAIIKSSKDNWSDVFSDCNMLLIDDIDTVVSDEEIAQKLGGMIDYALNMNVQIIVTTQSNVDEWPASRLWDVLRSGVKTVISPVGAGSLMLYARQLSISHNLILNDDQLATIVTHGNIGWRATKNSILLIENLVKNGTQIIDVKDVYNALNNISSEAEELIDEMQTEKVEDIANRLITSALDVVYSDYELGGIELNSELPELSDDYKPPELDIDSYLSRDRDYVETHIKNTLDDLTPVAPSVIDINDSEQHLVAKMNRIIEKDHSRAAEILTEIDMSLDKQFTQSDLSVRKETNQIGQLEQKLLELADRTSNASMEDLIAIADELRELEYSLVSLGSSRNQVNTVTEEELAESLEIDVAGDILNTTNQKLLPKDLNSTENAELVPIKSILQPHPEGAIRVSNLTPVEAVLTGEE